MALDPFAPDIGLDVTKPVEGLDPFAPPTSGLGPFRKGFGAGVAGVKSSLAGAGALAARVVGAKELEAAALEKAAAEAEVAAQANQPIEKVDFSSPSAVIDQFKWLLGNALPSLATMFAGGVVGRGLGALAGRGAAAAKRTGTLIGAVAPDVALEAGGIFPEALQTGVENPALRAIAGGTAAASLDFLPLLAAERYLKAAGRGGFGALLKGAVKGAPVGAVLEGAQETGQSAIERLSAGRPLTGDEALSDYINSFAGGAAPGLVFGAGIGAHRGAAAPRESAPVQVPPAFTPPEQPPVVNVPTPEPALPTLGEDLTPPLDLLNPLTEQARAGVYMPPGTVADPFNRNVSPEAQDADLTRRDMLATQHAQLTARVAELEPASVPVKGRKTSAMVTAQRAAAAELETVKAQLGAITPELGALDEAIKTRRKTLDVLAETPEGLNPAIIPKVGSEIPSSGIIQTKPETEPEAIDRAVKGVHALFREQGMLLGTTREALATPTKTPREVALEKVAGRAPRERVKPLTPEELLGEREARAIRTAQAAVEIVVAEKVKGSVRDYTPAKQAVLERKYKDAVNSVVQEAARLPTLEERQKRAREDIPKALPGLDKETREAVADEVARTLYSKGAVEQAPALSFGIQPVGTIMYHVTGTRNRGSIQQGGLRQSDIDKKNVWLFPRREDAVKSAREGMWGGSKGDNHIWAVNVGGLNIIADPHPGFEGVETRVAQEAITADRLHFLESAHWSTAALTSDQFHALPRPAQEAAVDLYNRAMTELGHKLIARLRMLVGDDPHLTVSTYTAEPGGPVGGYTRTGPLKAVISMALNAKNGLSIADHEGFHYAEDRVLTSPERQIVANAFKPGRPLFEKLMESVRRYDIENKTRLADEVASIPAEARAYGFEFWRRGELQPEGALARVFEKIRLWFEKVANLVKGFGFQSIEDVFKALDMGQFAEREKNMASGLAGFDSRSAPDTWYRSALTDQVTALNTKQASAQGWKDQIKGLVAKGIVKQAEIDAVGLNEFLDLRQGKVTKDQVVNFLRENGVRVEETELGGVAPEPASLDDIAIRELGRPYAELTPGERHDVETQQGIEQMDMPSEPEVPDAPKFATYQLPGGTNYRELLLTLPGAKPNVLGWTATLLLEGTWKVSDASGKTVDHVLATDETDALLQAGRKQIQPQFRSTHFDQPNILAHIRFNERTDADGNRVLFIEEIQSDWAQTGKREGFRKGSIPTKLPEGYKAVEVATLDVNRKLEGSGLWRIELPGGGLIGVANPDKIWAAGSALSQLVNRAHSGIPTAPFVTKTEAWVGLALKRMIRYAAENGFDKVAWTTGEQQAARYDLSKQVDEVRIFKWDNGKYSVQATKDAGRGTSAILMAEEEIPLSRVEELIGKDLAGKAEKQTKKEVSYTGIDLKVGGEGMKAFYDKIVPSVANDVLKKLGGGRVGEVVIGTERKPRQLTSDERRTMRSLEEAERSTLTRVQLDELNRLQDIDMSDEPVPKNQPGFTITPELATRAAAGLPLFSKAAVDMRREMQEGALQRQQEYQNFTVMHDRAAEHGPDNVLTAAYGAVGSEIKGGLARWWQKNMATTNFVSHFSSGVKNVYRTLNTYIRYRKLLIENMLRGKMPTWYHASFADQDITFAALLKRTVNGYARSSSELAELRRGLETPGRQRMFDDATKMIEGFLSAELESDRQEWKNFYIPGYESLPADRKAEMDALIEQHRKITPEQSKLLPDVDRVLYDQTATYREEITDREAQVAELIDKGYVPLRRYGDHIVVVTAIGKGQEGSDLVVNRMGFESETRAAFAIKTYQDEIKNMGLEGTYRVEPMGFQHKSARETTMSARQFIDTARRNGVPLTQPEVERIVKALTRADSMMRNRMMRREGTPGYSVDGMRVLNEFGVGMSGKLAYAQFASAIDAAAAGRTVESDVVKGVAVIKADEPQRNAEGVMEDVASFESRNLWRIDGPKSGHYRNLADEVTDYVLVPDHTGEWSKKLRGAAMVYFLGGSISGAMVNTMSVPMLTVPELSLHTPYYNAVSMALSSWKQAWQYQGTLRDLEKLKDRAAFPMKEIDAVPGLREAITEAADVIFDTEVHQIMGMAQGTVYSKSRTVQRAVEAWMQPFRISEQMNRATSFIAAYKVGQQNGLGGQKLFTFARELVTATQNNYDPSNRPGLARNPITAIMFMFKSFPLFMIEAATLMYKANPKTAVYMLLGLTMMTGVQGLPFAETLEDMIDTIAQRVFNSPFNTRRAMRNVIKQASEAIVGYDASELVLRGLINEVFGISASSRIGTGDFVPGTRLGTADADQGRVLEEMFGAPYAMLKDSLSQAGKLVSGVATLDWKQSVDALRAGGPVAVRNVIKGVEQLSDGYASDSKGRRLVDIGTPSALFQLIGLSSAGLAAAYDRDRTDKQVLAFYTQVRADMEHQLARAIKDGDSARAQDVWDAATAWDASNPDMPLRINPAAIRRQIVLSGLRLDERTLKLLPRQLRGTSLSAEGM